MGACEGILDAADAGSLRGAFRIPCAAKSIEAWGPTGVGIFELCFAVIVGSVPSHLMDSG